MAKKVEKIYEDALEKIRGISWAPGSGDDVAQIMKDIANEALLEAEDNSVDKDKLILDLRDFLIANGLIFHSAEDIADALNANGTIRTVRGKPWSKASVARLMMDVRKAIIAVTAKTEPVSPLPNPEAVAVENITRIVEPAPATVASVAEALDAQVVTPATPIEEVVAAVEEVELDDLELLEQQLAVA